ncbi:MAG: roadblock/LC7 domain-containing protein [Gaiellaceae bacterium]|jgi:predicted regulator of Ras-like GTPase activity (Roadblock/LC7/MglB family)
MDAQQALADLTEISSQIEAAVVFDDKGKLLGSTRPDGEAFAKAVAELLAAAEELKTGDSALGQLEIATNEGSVFVVREGKTTIAATTPPAPTVGLVFYDLKSALRTLPPKPPPRPRTQAKPKPDAKKKSASAKKATAKKPPAARPKKPDAP